MAQKETMNAFTARFLSRSVNEGFARAAAAAFIAQLDPTLDELYDLKTAVSEAVTNATVHAYGDALGFITLSIKLIYPATVEIIIKDKGCGIGDIQKAREPMFTTGGSDRSGMGFTIMESFMDRLTVRSAPGKGTTVRMQKAFSLRAAKPQ